uniref:Protocadherin Fat 4-like n=1 Tax=Saccoglossus kowalevskii TaxID=10224 RepID=A0ABM0N156_SACKO|nr:PREDICTED: protocadherin Fat 4-like [Saccoglossus kowalevskii]
MAQVCDISWTNTPHSVDENANTGTVVIPNTDVTGNFYEGQASPSYDIDHLDPGPDGLFTIDANNGAIMVGSDIDFELVGPIQTVYVQCLQTTSNNDVYAVTVLITDQPESPVYRNLPQVKTILEDIGGSVSIYRILYRDDDADTPTFTIDSQSPATPTFTIVNGDEVWTPAAGLDYESGDTIFTIDISADDGTAAAATIDTLTIHLSDVIDESVLQYRGIYRVNEVNEYTPMFTPSFHSTTVSENRPASTTIATLTVSDEDTTDTLTLTIESGDDTTAKFAVSGNDIITTSDALDYEDSEAISKNHEYRLMVSAEDGASHRSTATVIIELQNENEATPTFTTFPSTAITVSENEASGFIVLAASDIDASDTDEGALGQLTYSIQSVTNGGANKFYIDLDTGEIVTATSFDYEADTFTSYDITVKVQDGGSPIPSSTASVLTVDIGDYNDNEPTFDVHIYTAYIDETAAVSDVAVTLTVTDADSASTLTYSFVSGNADGKFEFNQANHQITVKNAIDLDVGADDPEEYILVVEVTDGGSPELSGTSTVIIMVTSSNDHDPVFDAASPTAATVSENTSPGTSVATVIASDDDSGVDGIVNFAIQGGDINDNFQIDSSSGLLEVKSVIDYEVTGSPITLTIKLSDEGSPTPRTATSDIIITVTNENDNEPTCTKNSYITSIGELSLDGASVIQLDCEDLDNDVLTYIITAGNIDANFEVSATGLVTLVTGHTVDYESAVKSYTLTVEVDDASTTLVITVTINVDPENDENCYFDTSSWSEDVNENANTGDVIADASSHAHDIDVSPHGIVSYSIISVTPSSGDTVFSISTTSGQIQLLEALDYETDTGYIITIEIEDGSAATAQADLQINVIDINDNYPVCSLENVVVEIDEGMYNIAVVTGVFLNCTDYDDGVLGTLSYSLTSQDPCCEFTEDGVTGDVNLPSDTLDFDASSRRYDLILQVSDGDASPKSIEIPITVLVNPVDEGPPAFAGPFSTSVAEDVDIGTLIELCTATDPDSTDTTDGQISYYITDGDPDAHFAIGRLDGKVTTIALLDREVVSSYTLEITAYDGNGGTDTQTLTVTVTDVNDYIPSCNVTTFWLELEEDISPGIVYTLFCEDYDPADSTLAFTITAGDSTTFNINSNGELSLQSPGLDYDYGRRSYDIEITVEDSVSNTFVVHGIVYVLAVDDGPPVFSGSYSVNVAEDTAASTTLITVVANDPDANDTVHGEVTYSLAASCSCPEFAIDAVTGEVILLQTLDFETSQTHTVDIEAYDRDTIVTASISVTVTDVNDNNPVFDPRMYSVSIDEGLSAGEAVVTVIATDVDSTVDDNNVIQFSITDGNTGSHFSIDSSTGDITTADVLDYEAMQVYNLEVTATDLNGGADGLTDVSYVTVVVNAVNEATPVFQSTPYSVSVPEVIATGESVFQVNVTDDDLPSHPHGQVKCEITAGNSEGHFSIDGETGIIYTTSLLDRENIASYTLTVTATDSTITLGDQLSSSEDVIITVEDENDNIPKCNPSVYATSIPESIPVGTTVIVVTTEDPDDGTNAQIDLTKLSGDPNNDFSLVGNEVLVASALAHHITDTYEIIITATDQGTTSLSSECSISIVVLSENNFPPEFSTALDAVSVSEYEPLDTVIYTVVATDDDEGQHGDLSYFITDGNDEQAFMLDETTGDIIIALNLDRERTSSYALEITVFDNGDNVDDTFNDTMTLNIEITDENDNSPAFSQMQYVADTDENIAVGTSVTQVVATDRDIGTNDDIVYSIIAGLGQGYFSIQSDTGVINTASDIDAELMSLYSFHIQAVDGGSPQKTSYAVVQIIINDLNDNTPVFVPATVVANVYEDSAENDQVYTMYAMDDDVDSDGGDPSNQFRISDTTGELTVSGIGLDRETDDSYNLIIEAEDGGVPTLTGTTTLTVSIMDVNDNPPVIDQASYSESIPEDSYIGLVVCDVDATDEDIGANARLSYSFSSGNELGHFAIDTDTGIITIDSELDHEAVVSYVLAVTVSDNGTPVMAADVDVTVNVNDVNDNIPLFTMETYTFNVLENSAAGTLVNTIVATDLDEAENGRIIYSIVSGENLNHFAIDSDSGDIFVAVSDIDRENFDYYSLTCKATDNGDLSLFSEATVLITVLDENDNSPVFTLDVYETQLTENSPVGTSVTVISATDIDQDINADIRYSIPASQIIANEYFKVDSTSGEITVKFPIDSDTIPYVEFTVYAEDSGAPTMRGTATVLVYTRNINDNIPRFDPEYYSTEFSYLNTLHQPITTVMATDGDRGQLVSYHVVDDGADLFEIDENDGYVYLIQNKAPDVYTKYVITVEARDDWTPQLSSTVNAIVRMDTFDPYLQLVDFYMSVTEDEFEASKDEFLERLKIFVQDDYPTARCGVSHITRRNRNPSQSRRKLLADE